MAEEKAKTEEEIAFAATVTPESAKRKVTSSKSVNTAQISDAQLGKELAKAKAAFSGEKKVKFSIPKVLAKDFGPTLFVGVNGVFVNIPVDGKEYEIPETLAKHAKRTIDNLK